ncbi:DUF6364 family protein [Nonlabens antarcticus]|uniref:DUF6364 family protein n=1 Tax=Nonlabens antarcticus TaxID=392714 RepID=UPI0018919A46|nr:DUF6364 family protein [Nonlabens antarcticus]
MNTKLTLSIKKDVIEMAKVFAKEQNQSLSKLVENYLKHISGKKQISIEEDELSPWVDSLKGALTPPKCSGFDYDYKKILQEELEKKYL